MVTEVLQHFGGRAAYSWKEGDKGQYLPNQKYACWKWLTEKGKEAILIDKLVDELIEKLKAKVEIINRLKEKD